MISVVIPSNRSYKHIEPLLFALDQQTLLPEQIVIVYDAHISADQYEEIVTSIQEDFQNIGSKITLISTYSDAEFRVGLGASYVRNYGAKKVQSKLVLFVDDDNIFDNNFIEKLFTTYHTVFQKNEKGVVMPLEELRKTGEKRFYGYDFFHPLFVRPIKSKYRESHYKISFGPSNCFLCATSLWQEFPFNEALPFIYEDFLFFLQIYNAGYEIYLDPNTKTYHMMRQKTKLQDLYIGSVEHAYQKGKNRSLLIKKTASLPNKIIYFTMGIRGQTLYLLFHIWYYAPLQKKFTLTLSLLQGTVRGIFSNS